MAREAVPTGAPPATPTDAPSLSLTIENVEHVVAVRLGELLTSEQLRGAIQIVIDHVLASDAFVARVRALQTGAPPAAVVAIDSALLTPLVEKLTAHFVTIDEIRPEAIRRARAGMRP